MHHEREELVTRAEKLRRKKLTQAYYYPSPTPHWDGAYAPILLAGGVVFGVIAIVYGIVTAFGALLHNISK